MVATEQKTRYEELVSLGKDLNRLVRLGFISCNILNWKSCYESYLNESTKKDTSVAVLEVAHKHKISERQVYKIIRYMKSN